MPFAATLGVGLSGPLVDSEAALLFMEQLYSSCADA